MTLKLNSARIQNFKSLGDVTLNFRDLTILVGANSSGKSNCLESLDLMKEIVSDEPPLNEKIKPLLKKNSKEDIILEISVKDQDSEKVAVYQVSLKVNTKLKKVQFSRETLKVDDTLVIEVANKQGKVWDEDGKNPINYESKTGNLAVKSAGDFGNKPITSQLSEVLKNWIFYDFEPRMLKVIGFPFIFTEESKYIDNLEKFPQLDTDGEGLPYLLYSYASKNEKQIFNKLNQDLRQCLGITLSVSKGNKEKEIQVKEGNNSELSLSSMSDGTLRMITYYAILHQENIPPLIGIEEPERNFHPKMLMEIARFLKKLSQKTQVIITTHSSQLLDCFTLDEIKDDIAVILLSKQENGDTQAYLLDELAEKQEDLAEWMNEFGVGSAIYHSQLLQDLLQDQQYA